LGKGAEGPIDLNGIVACRAANLAGAGGSAKATGARLTIGSDTFGDGAGFIPFVACLLIAVRALASQTCLVTRRLNPFRRLEGDEHREHCDNRHQAGSDPAPIAS